MDTSRCEMSRRQLVGGLVGLAAGPSIKAQPLFRATELNHVTLNVSDLERSRAFYGKLFGGPQWTVPPPTMLSFDLGASPLGIYMLSAQDNSPGIGHFCIAVQDLNLDAAVSALTQRSADAEKAGDRAVQFRDPDRIHIELVPPKYRNPRMELNIDLRTPEPLFRPVGLNHVTLQVSNLERSTKFYESLFGPSSTGRMPGSPAVRFGKGELGWITYGVNPVGIDHFCVSVEGYDADAVTRKLKQNGIASQRPYAQNQVFVRDPDGILVQLA